MWSGDLLLSTDSLVGQPAVSLVLVSFAVQREGHPGWGCPFFAAAFPDKPVARSNKWRTRKHDNRETR